jgi:hypothetical protein
MASKSDWVARLAPPYKRPRCNTKQIGWPETAAQSRRMRAQSRAVEQQDAVYSLVRVWRDMAAAVSVEVFVDRSPKTLGWLLCHRRQFSTMRYASDGFRSLSWEMPLNLRRLSLRFKRHSGRINLAEAADVVRAPEG